jgi:A/G-specific adenine glycosylase
VAAEILLEQRPAELSVMPGLWELPLLLDPLVPDADLRMSVRHAIMQVNYYVRIRTLREEEVDALTVPGGKRLWVSFSLAGRMALTGLTRKVLSRARLIASASKVAPSGTPAR